MMGNVRRRCNLLLSLAAVALSLCATLYAARATCAHYLYFSEKYGNASGGDTDDGTASHWEQSYTLYPHNYHLCIEAMERAWHSRFAGEVEDLGRVHVSEKWCDRGLTANPFLSQLRLHKTILIERESVEDAIAYWREYVDQNYWVPFNHAFLTDLYTRGGQFTYAFESLEMVEGSPHEKDVRARLFKAWDVEMGGGP